MNIKKLMGWLGVFGKVVIGLVALLALIVGGLAISGQTVTGIAVVLAVLKVVKWIGWAIIGGLIGFEIVLPWIISFGMAIRKFVRTQQVRRAIKGSRP